MCGSQPIRLHFTVSFAESLTWKPSLDGKIKPNCSMTPDKDVYSEFALEFSLTTRKIYNLASFGNKNGIEKWETW